MTSLLHGAPLWAYVLLGLAVGALLSFALALIGSAVHHRIRLVVYVKCEGAFIMAQAISVQDTHAPLQLTAGYVNAKGKPVPAPTPAPPLTWAVDNPVLASQAPLDAANVVTLTGVDGSFNVSVSDGTFTDSLPVSVTPDQTPAGIAISVSNP